MEPRLQKRVQRYGWDLAADDYERLWGPQLSVAQATLLQLASPAAGERVLDVACGTGLVTFAAAGAVGPQGEVLGVDISGQMIEAARRRSHERQTGNVSFARMDAEALKLAPASFDLVLCALGLMYAPEPERALREMRRVLRPGGRMVVAIWGERARCGWSPAFQIVDDEVVSEVCPLFFRMGAGDTLARLCAEAGFEDVEVRRLSATLAYADAEEACDAAFVGGPMAMAWSRFDAQARARARARYVAAITPWRAPGGYGLPAEFVVAAAVAPPTKTEGEN